MTTYSSEVQDCTSELPTSVGTVMCTPVVNEVVCSIRRSTVRREVAVVDD